MEGGSSARVFLAVSISREVAASVARAQAALGGSLFEGLFRFVDPEQAHVTLRFLGQRSEEEQVGIARAATAVAKRNGPFTLSFGGLGVFPDDRRPHTLWMGLTEGKATISALAKELETALAGEGFPPEERPFVPHLTLARVKKRPPLGIMKRLFATAVEPSGVQSVESFSLMESRAVGAAVRYVPLQIFRLEGACTRFE